LGYVTGVITDGSATRSLPGPDGETIPAPIVHAAALAALQDRVSWMVSSADLVSGRGFEDKRQVSELVSLK
jgi:hypothetical protein